MPDAIVHPRSSRFEDGERALQLALFAAAWTSLLLITAPTFPDGPLGLQAGRWWTPWILTAYAVVAVLVQGVSTIAAVVLRKPWLRRIGLRIAAVLFLVVASIASVDALPALLARRGEPVGIVILACLGAGVLGVVLLAWPKPSLFLLRLLAILALGGGFVILHPRLLKSVPNHEPPAIVTPASGERLLVIGLDGADWRYIEPLIARGELPNLARLRDSGAWGPLETLVPTSSPLIWTTMATGRRPEDHGIRGHISDRPRGAFFRLPELPASVNLLGVPQLLAVLRKLGLVVGSPCTSDERLVPAYWNMASYFGSPTTVISWWATWPAEPILGRMVSDRAYFWRWAVRGAAPVAQHLTFPETLYGQLERLMMRPDQMTLDDARRLIDIDREDFVAMQNLPYEHHHIQNELKYYYSMFMTDQRMARRLIDLDRSRGKAPMDLLVLFRIIDHACHSSLAFSELVDEHPGTTPEELRKYGRVVTAAYQMADETVGELIDAFGPANVVVLSDHGFEYESATARHPARYNHSRAPDGVFIASGPAFAPGRVDGLSVYHVLPILLGLKGFPQARDHVEGPREDLFDDGFMARHPVRWIDSYAFLASAREARDGSAVDAEMIDRLKALGYVN